METLSNFIHLSPFKPRPLTLPDVLNPVKGCLARVLMSLFLHQGPFPPRRHRYENRLRASTKGQLLSDRRFIPLSTFERNIA